MQRTGGTTLAALLANLSEHPGVQHEPFNAERIFGHVTEGWVADRDPVAMRAALVEALAERTPVIKHCHELVPAPVNEELMRVASGLGYRHMVLDRRAEVDRILSLETPVIEVTPADDRRLEVDAFQRPLCAFFFVVLQLDRLGVSSHFLLGGRQETVGVEEPSEPERLGSLSLHPGTELSVSRQKRREPVREFR